MLKILEDLLMIFTFRNSIVRIDTSKYYFNIVKKHTIREKFNSVTVNWMKKCLKNLTNVTGSCIS